MPTCDSTPSCPFPCPWEGTGHCLRKLLGDRVAAQATLSHGQLTGLREFYYPHTLPPCLTEHGLLHYQPITAREEALTFADAWQDDGPGL
jgi:hypothetical protein